MRALGAFGILVLLIAIAGAIYLFSGYYNVAAREPDAGAVSWALINIRQASIKQRAPTEVPVSLDDTAVIQEGAKAFSQHSCATCHGAPGVKWAKFSEGMRPYAADLNKTAKNRPAGEIFWIVKNGIDMTGMPSFALLKVSDEEIWNIAAFIKNLPNVSADNYKAWTETGSPEPMGVQPANP